jgi:3-deoxy-manno-octulosonate cytidylyltransferase (CMP-KDO synthetase)
MPPSRLEILESLEQLRVLEAGHRIAVGVIPHAGCGIDTQGDYREFVKRHQAA